MPLHLLLDLPTNISPDIPPVRQALPRNRQPPARYREVDIVTAYISHKEDKDMALALKLRKEGVIRSLNMPFVNSRKKEIDGLLNQNVFKIVDIRDIPKGECLFGSRFVDNIKQQNGIPYEKSRLVV